MLWLWLLGAVLSLLQQGAELKQQRQGDVLWR